MSLPPNTIESVLADAANRLADVSDTPKLDAETLLSWVLDAPRSHLFTHPEQYLSEHSSRAFADALARRENGEPVAYITGSKEFWSLQLKVTADTLIPRPETETLVEQALTVIPRDYPCRVLDLGTGSGAVAIAIASERPNCEIAATDSSRAALSIAIQNADQHRIANIRFVEGAWTEPVSERRFDVIVCNPPYVREDDPALDRLQYEPRSALASGPDGLDAIRTIAAAAKVVMNRNGTLLLEHGADQQHAVSNILRQNGWTDVVCSTDLSGHPRVTAATMKPTET